MYFKLVQATAGRKIQFKLGKNSICQTWYFKLENCKNQVQINRRSGLNAYNLKFKSWVDSSMCSSEYLCIWEWKLCFYLEVLTTLIFMKDERNGILFPKLFRPILWEKIVLVIEKNLSSLKQFIQRVEDQCNFWNLFLEMSQIWSNTLEQLKFKLEKNNWDLDIYRKR